MSNLVHDDRDELKAMCVFFREHGWVIKTWYCIVGRVAHHSTIQHVDQNRFGPSIQVFMGEMDDGYNLLKLTNKAHVMFRCDLSDPSSLDKLGEFLDTLYD